MRTHLAFFGCALALIGAAGCSDNSTPPGTDSGIPGVDTGVGMVDTGVPPNDTGVPPNDTGVPPNDTGVPPTDTGVPPEDTGVAPTDTGVAPTDTGVAMTDSGSTTDGGLMCAAGVECTNWAAAIGAATRGAAGATEALAVMNCVVQVHQSDCCGARRAYGINHASRMDLCTAESSCRSMYTTPASCSDNTITTDTGETTTNANQVRVHAVNPMSCSFGTCYTCETFVCMGATCSTLPGITAGQCGP